MKGINKFLEKIGRSVGGVVGVLYQAGRESVEQTMTNIIPFMAFISMVIGVILYTGIGDLIANYLSPLAGSVGGLIVMSLIVGLPVLSPLLGPGAVMAQIIGSDHRHLAGSRDWPRQHSPPILPASSLCHQPPGGLRLHSGRSFLGRGQTGDR